MKVMLKYELKRIFTKRLNRVLITIGLALSVILSFLAATSNRFVSPQGHLETGISATRKVVADKNRNKCLKVSLDLHPDIPMDCNLHFLLKYS